MSRPLLFGLLSLDSAIDPDAFVRSSGQRGEVSADPSRQCGLSDNSETLARPG